MSEGMNYVAIRPECGHCVGAVVVDGKHPELVDRSVRGWHLRGLRILERESAWVREHLGECDCPTCDPGQLTFTEVWR